MGKVEQETEDVVIYSSGLCYCSVCADANIELSQLTESVNRQHPTGIKSDWELAEESFSTGEPNPCECPDDESRIHILIGGR